MKKLALRLRDWPPSAWIFFAWLITLSDSFVVNPDDPPALALWSIGTRDYKTYTVRKSDGEVTSMKIRDLAAV